MNSRVLCCNGEAMQAKYYSIAVQLVRKRPSVYSTAQELGQKLNAWTQGHSVAATTSKHLLLQTTSRSYTLAVCRRAHMVSSAGIYYTIRLQLRYLYGRTHYLAAWSYLEIRWTAKISKLIYVELFSAHSYNFVSASYNVVFNINLNLHI